MRTLPAELPSRAASLQSSDSTRPIAYPAQPVKKRALCATDHEDTSEILAALLKHRGYEVVCAHSFITALLSATGQTFNLYVLDAQLQRDMGTALCRNIREVDPLTPIILSSSSVEAAARLAAMESGASFYILKTDVRALVEALSLVPSDAPPVSAERRVKAGGESAAYNKAALSSSRRGR